MARVTGPLMSIDASGTLAKSIVASKWKGRNYMRRWVIPHNPKSDLQVSNRAMMQFVSQQWAMLSSPDQATWDDIAHSMKISPFNAYIRGNMMAYGNFDPPYQATPPAEATTAPSAPTLTPTVYGKLMSMAVALAPAGGEWGVIVAISDATITTPVKSMIQKLAPYASGVTYIEVGPFTPGTYHVKAAVFTVDGVWGSYSTDHSFTIT